jgi:hypothetical protein
MIKKIAPRLGDLFLVLVLIVLTISVYKFLLIVPLDSVIGDAQRYNGYQAYIVKYSLDTYGQFALWDQFLSSGMSWISHPGGPLFFPTAWIIITFFEEMMLGSRVYFFIHAITAVIAMYFFLRVFGLKKFPSFVVSIISVATQYSLIFGINGWFEEFFGLTLMPLTLGLLWLTLTKNSYAYAILGGLAMSLHFFGNSYYVFHYNVIAILWIELVFLVRELRPILNQKKKELQGLLKYFVLNIVFWTVFVGISGVKLLPLLEFRDISARNILPLSIVEGNVLPFSFLSKIFRDFIIPAGHTTSFTQLANDLAVFFVLLSFIYFLLKRSFKYGVLLGLFIIALWGYFANLVPIDLYAFIYNFLPGFNSNNYPYRFMIIINFAFLVLVALGLNMLISKKSRSLNFLGISAGIIMVISTIFYASTTTAALKFPRTINIEDKIRDFPNFQIIKTQDLNSPPKLIGKAPDNLLTILSIISKEYGSEGRTYSTINSLENGISSINAFNGKIRSVHHSYDPIVPSYQYAITPQSSTKVKRELTEKRYKVFSVLNTRFQFQGKDFFEYEGCKKLSLIGQITPDQTESQKNNCEFLEARLEPLTITETGGLYYDKNVLPNITIIPNPILLIGDNRFNDYSGFIAKQIMFHPNFDINSITVLSGGSSYLDDYDLKKLKQFSAVVLIEPKIRDENLVSNLLNQYENNGGKVLRLKSSWKEYNSLHERSGSLWSDKPAWIYSGEDSRILSVLFNSLKVNQTENLINVKKFTPEDILISVETRKNNQVLQFSDSFYPGWKASVDGKEMPVYMANGLVKGVIIEKAGNHTVRFYYNPDSFKKGALISGFTVLVSVGGFLHLLRRRIYRHS